MELIDITVREAADGWTLSAGAHGAPARHGAVPRTAVDHLGRVCAALALAAGDPALTAAEAEVAAAFAAALERSGGPWDVLWRAASRTEARREPLVLVIDAEERLRALPWELIGLTPGQPPLEVAGRGAVVRRVAHAPPPALVPGGPLRVVVGRLGPDSPELEGALEALRHACAASGLPGPAGLDVGPGPRVLTLLGGDGTAAGCGTLLTSSVPTPGDALLAGASLVVLGECGTGDGRAVRGLAARAVLAGAHAAVHTDGGVSPSAIGAFSAGLHHALGGGALLLDGVLAGRRAVAAQRADRAEGRWWRLRLLTGTPSALARAPRPPRWRPRTWPQPGAVAADVLDRALALADPAGGVVGVEHLAAAWVERTPPGADAVADRMRALAEGWLDRVATLAPREDATSEGPRVSPRLAAVAGALRDGFDMDALWALLLHDTGAWGRWFADPALLHALWEQAAPATDLAVLGGPEDGRRLDLGADDVIGRAGPDRTAGPALYADTQVTDAHLSRRALRWTGDGRVEVLTPLRGLPDGEQPEPAAGGLRWVRVGDLLELTGSTRLVGVGPRESRTP